MRVSFSTPLRAPAGAEAGRVNSPDTLCINTIRTLVMDAVQNANSGHPGAAMSMAPIAYTLWQNTLNYDPTAPLWPNRDRFVLSIGHASMLLYALIHVAGIRQVTNGKVTDEPALSVEDLRQFRQFGSKTPGHPEYGHTTGVETTTGPLGAGCGNSVGMAIAEKWLAARYNMPGFTLFDHHVYTLCGDGDMMEGVSSEAASLAAHLELGNLTWIYDSNRISIEGSTYVAFTENVAERFAAYGWQVLELKDANDTAAFAELLAQSRAQTSKPTLIIAHSVIAWGAPHKAGKHPPMVSLWVRKKCAKPKSSSTGPKTAALPCLMPFCRTCAQGLAHAGWPHARHGKNCSRTTAPPTRKKRANWTPFSAAPCPKAGMRIFRFTRQTPRALPRAPARAKC